MAVPHPALLCFLAVLCFAADIPAVSPAATEAPSPTSFDVAPGLPSTADASASWVNSPNRYSVYMEDGSIVLPLLRSPVGAPKSSLCFGFGFVADARLGTSAYQLGVFIASSDGAGYPSSISALAPPLVWSANPSRPVAVNATVQFAGGDLVLRDADGTLVWSSGTAGKPVAGVSLASTGNLELFDNKKVSLWESFNHPTSVLLLGQSLRKGMRLTAGRFFLTVLYDGLYAFVSSNPPQPYYFMSISGIKPIYRRQMQNGSLSLIFQNGSLAWSDDQEMHIFSLPPVAKMQYLSLDESDGHLRLYDNPDLNIWNMVADVFSGPSLDTPMSDCTYPTFCGDYGICTNGECSCPGDHFSLIDSRLPNLGCKPAIPLSCHTEPIDQELLTLPGIDYFHIPSELASLTSVAPMISEDDCRKLCMKNCSCKAAVFRYTSDRTSGVCYLKTDVFSMHTEQKTLGIFYNASAIPPYNSTMYIKVQLNTSSPNQARNIGISIVAGIVAIAIIIAGITILRRLRKNASEEDDYLNHVLGLPTRYSYEELRAATKDFSVKLGQGAFASVFEGIIKGEKVAVKQLDRVSNGKKDFLAEVGTIGSIHHVNLIRLVGFCAEKSHHLLVYEYMPRGSLDNWIFRSKCSEPLDWFTRTKIIKDIAKGLCYLHEGCEKKVAHLDIKPQNILLDENFSAKISDFGVSKLIERDRSQVMTRMRGTPGYLAPEWLISVITEKADIYSFGIVMMEIICGRKNLDETLPEEQVHLTSLLEEKVRRNALLDLVDSASQDMQLYREDVVEAMKLAMWCLQMDSNGRPMMSSVVNVLEGRAVVKTDIDFNFVLRCIEPVRVRGEQLLKSSFSPSASMLSGPR